MMPAPQGLQALLAENAPDRIAIVEIVSTALHGADGDGWKPQYAPLIFKGLPRERVFSYIPPPFPGGMPRSDPASLDALARMMPQYPRFAFNAFTQKFYRQERLPDIRDPMLAYIIADDAAETGATLRCASDALSAKGVPLWRQWFYVWGVEGMSDQGPFLDRVETFLAYFERMRTEDAASRVMQEKKKGKDPLIRG